MVYDTYYITLYLSFELIILITSLKIKDHTGLFLVLKKKIKIISAVRVNLVKMALTA